MDYVLCGANIASYPFTLPAYPPTRLLYPLPLVTSRSHFANRIPRFSPLIDVIFGIDDIHTDVCALFLNFPIFLYRTFDNATL